MQKKLESGLFAANSVELIVLPNRTSFSDCTSDELAAHRDLLFEPASASSSCVFQNY